MSNVSNQSAPRKLSPIARAKRLAEATLRRMIPRSAHSSIRLWIMGPWHDAKPELITSFDNSPVVVIAPHPDDEVIGPGGTIRRHILAGAPVTVVVVSDGRWGGFDPDKTLVARRKQESRDAAKIMKTQEPIFLDMPDGKISEDPAMVDRLTKLIVERKARYIYLPALTDGHSDHWSTNRLIEAVVRRLPPELAANLVLRGYEVWTPVIANRTVDITAVVDVKRKAIDAFPSQTSVDDYTEAALGLNRYRSLQHLHGRGYAEAFMEMSAAGFLKLFQWASQRHLPRD